MTTSIETIRAAVDAVVPGASALRVEEHVTALVEKALPGYSDVIAALLDAYGAEHGGPFVSLKVEGQRATLRAMASDESQDIRDAADAIFVFAYGGYYSEWGKSEMGEIDRAIWDRIGFRGPSLGHPDFAE